MFLTPDSTNDDSVVDTLKPSPSPMAQSAAAAVEGRRGEIDASSLRGGLRLVHCLQKERGASCAFFATTSSCDMKNPIRALEMMEAARRDCNSVIEYILHSSSSSLLLSSSHSENIKFNIKKRERVIERVKSSLQKIRRMIQTAGSLKKSTTTEEDRLERELGVANKKGGAASSNGIHRILVCFDAVISHVVHEYFLEHIALKNNVQQRKSGKYRRLRSASSGGGSESELLFNFWDQPKLPSEINGNEKEAKEQTKSISFGSDVDAPISTSKEDRILRLLNVLGVFVRLKESTGRERAILSIILVAGKFVDPKFYNDLVLQVENQRRLVDDLVHLPRGPMKNLVVDSVGMSSELLDLQNKILVGLNIEGIEQHHKNTNLWDLMTVYIDKLHAIELLIIEEIEFCKHMTRDEDESSNNCHNTQGVSTQRTSGNAADIEDDHNINHGPTSTTNDGKNKNLAEDSSNTGSHQGTDSAAATAPATAAGENHNKEAEPCTAAGTGEDPFTFLTSAAPKSKEWEIDLYELKFLKRIGEGAAGTTYLAMWSGQKVAVKVASITETGLEGFRTEVQALQKLHHSNIIRLLGSVYHQNPLTFCLVLEYCDGGDLSAAMRLPTPPNFFFHVAASIANGMSYLHSRGVIHRDIKPSNVLCHGNIPSGNFQVKVSDFGVATDDNDTLENSRTGETGTYRWMAPEVIQHKPYSNSADIYSFAMLMWQLLTREEPFVNLSQIEAAGKVALEGARPPFPDGTPKFVMKLIADCWNGEPDKRLSFDEISKQLKVIEKGLLEVERVWLESPLGNPVYRPRHPSSLSSDSGSDNGNDDDSSSSNNNDLMIPSPPKPRKHKECKNPRSLLKLFSFNKK